jgi:hypothetical protein
MVNNEQVIYGGAVTQANVVNNGITPLTTKGTGTGTEKRKQDAETPSSTPEEKETASPNCSKPRQHETTTLIRKAQFTANDQYMD